MRLYAVFAVNKTGMKRDAAQSKCLITACDMAERFAKEASAWAKGSITYTVVSYHTEKLDEGEEVVASYPTA